MLPTYAPDKLHFVNRLAYGAAGPARGDVVAIQLGGTPRALRQAGRRAAR